MSLEKALATIEKKFGKESIMRYGDAPKETAGVISTGVPSLNKALGIGGLPKGRLVEIYGPESSGKTTLTLHTIAECQKAGGSVAFIDVEHALDSLYAEKLGVDMENILISQPDSGEAALEIVEELVRSEEIDLVVLDSVAALATRAELDGEMGDATVAGVARLMSKALRKLTHITSKNNCTIIFINQLRDKIGGMGYGPTEITTGGRALRFYASVRLDIRRIGSVKAGEEIVGNKTKIKVVKNKLSPPHKEVETSLIFGEGISLEYDVIDVALDKGILTQKGAWISYDGKNISQGKANLYNLLKEDKVLLEELKGAIDGNLQKTATPE